MGSGGWGMKAILLQCLAAFYLKILLCQEAIGTLREFGFMLVSDGLKKAIVVQRVAPAKKSRPL